MALLEIIWNLLCFNPSAQVHIHKIQRFLLQNHQHMFNRLNAIYETKINSNAACKAILPTYDPFFAVSIDTTGGIRDTRVRQNTAEMYSMLILLKNFDTWKTILS